MGKDAVRRKTTPIKATSGPVAISPYSEPARPALRSILPFAGRGERRFALVFFASSATLLGLYYFPYSDESAVHRWTAAYLHDYAAIAGTILRGFDRTVRVVGQDILGRFSLRIVKTCDAMDVQLLLLSAVLALPVPWPRRLCAASITLGIVFVANVLRICSLYFIGIYLPSSFEVVHMEVWPALIVMIAVACFVAAAHWTRRTDIAPLAPS